MRETFGVIWTYVMYITVETTMKKLLILTAVGILGTLAIFKGLQNKQQPYKFVEQDQNGKNFGAFPPDIPEDQFENLFV